MGSIGDSVRFGEFEGMLEVVSCPIDGDRAEAELVFKNSDGIGFYSCRQCNLMFASPRFTEESMMKIYEIGAFADLEMFEDWSYDRWARSGHRSYMTQKRKVELTGKFVSPGGRLLDAGCGTGLFVLEATRRGFLCEGVEPSRMLSSVAKEVLSAAVSVMELEEFHPPYRFGGIFIWDVVEHLYDPVRVLRRCMELLEPGGYLFAQMPNHKGISNSLKTLLCRAGLKRSGFKHFGFPWHVYSFDKRSISALMGSVGLAPVLFESWPHMFKEGKDGAHIKAIKKFCLSDYIVCVAKKAGTP